MKKLLLLVMLALPFTWVVAQKNYSVGLPAAAKPKPVFIISNSIDDNNDGVSDMNPLISGNSVGNNFVGQCFNEENFYLEEGTPLPGFSLSIFNYENGKRAIIRGDQGYYLKATGIPQGYTVLIQRFLWKHRYPRVVGSNVTIFSPIWKRIDSTVTTIGVNSDNYFTFTSNEPLAGGNKIDYAWFDSEQPYNQVVSDGYQRVVFWVTVLNGNGNSVGQRLTYRLRCNHGIVNLTSNGVVLSSIFDKNIGEHCTNPPPGDWGSSDCGNQYCSSSNPWFLKKPAEKTNALYPNPAQNSITVQKNEDGLQIYNMLGQIVKKVQPQVFNIDISDLPKGQYILSSASDGKTNKFTKI